MSGQPQDECDWVLRDMDFRFSKPGIYGDHFYNQFYLDENCRFHRDDGPAFIFAEGDKVWFEHGLRHRDGGKPAVEYADGRVEYWLKGNKLTDDEVKEYKQKLLTEDWRKAAEDMVAEIHAGLKNDLRVMKPPRFG